MAAGSPIKKQLKQSTNWKTVSVINMAKKEIQIELYTLPIRKNEPQGMMKVVIPKNRTKKIKQKTFVFTFWCEIKNGTKRLNCKAMKSMTKSHKTHFRNLQCICWITLSKWPITADWHISLNFRKADSEQIKQDLAIDWVEHLKGA